jgi:hypothetical protein
MALVTRRGVHDRGGRWFWLLMAWTLISGLLVRSLAATALTEYKVKAEFLYHFGWFVDWPAATERAGLKLSSQLLRLAKVIHNIRRERVNGHADLP